MPGLEETIEEAATTPERGAADGVDITQRPLKDLIEADKYLTAKRAQANTWGGIKVQQLVPPGATGAT